MASYIAQSIKEAGVAEDRTSVRMSFVAGPEPVTVVMNWRLASELIDRLAIVNSEIKHALSAPDTRALRITTGCHRVGIALSLLMALPVLWGLWRWLQGELDADGWKVLAGFFVAVPIMYGVAWLVGWIVTGFLDTRQQGTSD
jgi:hypothetical protein